MGPPVPASRAILLCQSRRPPVCASIGYDLLYHHLSLVKNARRSYDSCGESGAAG